MKNISVLVLFILATICSEARLYFFHIPKTGGTTLRHLLELQVSAEDIYPYRNLNQVKDAIPITQELVSGHFPYWYCNQEDAHFKEAFKVTILRDPVERYLSFLRSKKKADATLPSLESVLNLKKKGRKYHYGLMENALCKHLAADPSLEGEQLLASAKQTLHELDYVLFFDQFEEDVLNLFQHLGITLTKNDIPKMNRTDKEAISEALLEEVRRLNHLDIQLYAYAKTHLQKKDSTYQLRNSAYHDLLTTTNCINYSFDLPLNGREWTYRDIASDGTVFRWVSGRSAFIYFHLEEGSDYTLYFSAHPLNPAVLPQVKVNGVEIEVRRQNQRGLFMNSTPQAFMPTCLDISGNDFSTYQGKIPKELITGEPTEIEFYAPQTFLYKEVYPKTHNRNYPPLSFAVSRITLSCSSCTRLKN